MTVGSIVSEPLIVNGLCGAKEWQGKAVELLESVGLDGAHVRRYPHEFSGGQRQRICIARAISTRPRLIVADEPVSSLDVLVQADILDLLTGLKEKFGVSYLFISHDLRIVSKICDRVCVMCEGKIVEELKASGIKKAEHPYTKELISAVPVADPTMRRLTKCSGGL
jgi:glutathione transport system ATP-binding protein